MKSKEAEYKELFYSEALENFEELNRLFTDLEGDPHHTAAIQSVFRIVHTLKGNAMGMGFNAIADLSHVMEDVMGAVQEGKMRLDKTLFDGLFKANDKLGGLIQALKTNQKVAYLGIKTKLSVMLQTAAKAAPSTQAQPSAEKTEKLKQEALDFLKAKEAPSSTDDASTLQAIRSEITFTDVIQMPIKKMDQLMTLVGQLMIERDRLLTHYTQQGQSTHELETLQRMTSELQYQVMNARMVQVSFLFNKFHRVVRDLCAMEGKAIGLELEGTTCEIDRNILKIMSDALIHLVRNAVSHGIEPTEQRTKAGKPEKGKITLRARYERDKVILEVVDDGAGIDSESIRKKVVEKGLASSTLARSLSDEEVMMYIFESGFSNADRVTEISGRGVGMDVVKKTTESIGGQVKIQTQVGVGSVISLFLPSSMALKAALLFEVQRQEYAIALSYTEAVFAIEKQQVYKVSDGLMTQHLHRTIPLVFLHDLIRLEKLSDMERESALHWSFDHMEKTEKLEVVMISYADKWLGIVVDKLLQQKEIIEKALEKPLEQNRLISGTTLLGNGRVCLTIDVRAVYELIFKNRTQPSGVDESVASDQVLA